MSGLPTVQFLLDDGTGTFPYDVTAYARLLDGFSFNRGREDEQSAVTSGSLSLAFNNADGRFTPGSTIIASPSPITVDQKIRLSESFLTNLTFDSGVDGWTGGNAVVASVATPVRNGAGAMRLTAIAGADMSGSTATGTSGVPVTPGATYRLSGWFRTAVTARSCFVRVRFYTAAGALVSTVVSSDVTDSTSGWTQASTTTVVPATAAFAGVSAVVKVPAAGEQHYVDDFWFGMDRFTGYVKSWRVGWPAGVDSHSVVQVTATDAQARAERRILKSVVEEEIAADGPAAHYPLGEPADSTSAADHSGNQAPSLTMAGTGTDVVFGNATGPGTDGLTAAEFAAGKYLAAPSTTSIATAAVVCAFSTVTAATAALVANATPTLLGIDSTGHLTGGVGEGLGLDLVSAATVTDGATHVAELRLDGATAHLLLDGVVVDTVASALTSMVVAPRVGVDFTGAIAHVALFTTDPGATRAAAHADAMLTGFAGESGTARITRLAGYAGIPIGTLDTSLTNVAFKECTGTTAWSAIADATDAEGGLTLVNGTGDTVFINRDAAPEKATPDLTLAAELVAFDAAPTDDDAEILNYLETTAEGTGVTQVVTDATSEATHGRYSDSKTYLVTTDAEALDRGNWLVGNRAEPDTRFGTLTVHLYKMTATQQQAAIAALGPGAWLRVTGMPAQTPGGTTVDVVVQGFTEEQSGSSWSLTCNVAARSKFQAWILGDSTYGVLGSTTKLYV